jgi:hypothetical protein
VCADAREFPEHDDAGADFDETVESETGESHRARSHGGDGEHDDADPVPPECDTLQGDAAAQQLDCRFTGHRPVR